MVSKHWHRCFAALACALLASGCSTLPDSGPTATEIDDAAKHNNQLGFRIVPVTQSVISALSASAPASEVPKRWTWQVPDSVTRVGNGDVLAVSIFVAGSGSFAASSAGGGDQTSAGAIQNENLPPLRVDERGNITIPYAGELHVAGLTPDDIEAAIDRRLSGTVFRPQAIVNVTQNIQNTVILSGDIHRPGRYPIEIAGERLQDLVAEAGGTGNPEADMLVTVTRGGNSVRTPLAELDGTISENLPLNPGDGIQLIYQPRTFLAFGAGGKVTQVKFDSSQLSLAEAIARVGGPQDDRADPTAVYLFRFETPRIAANLGMPASQTPVIYKINMLDPQSYFELEKFEMRDKDLIYVANAKTDRLEKLLGLIGLAFGPIGSTGNLGNF